MKSPSLSFTGITIREMPGFETGGFPIENLAAGVNIIYGPNASGKSSLSRAMGVLLRAAEEHGEDCSLVGKLMVDEESVLIDYRPGKVATQREGMEVQTQNLAPEAMEDRYILALADLLGDKDEADELTSKILREASGGYDIGEASKDAGFRSLASRSGVPQRDYREAAEELRSSHLEAGQLAEEEEELPDMERKLEQAEDADRSLQLITKAEKHLELSTAETAAGEAIRQFPAGMDKLQTDAPERLAGIAEEIENREADRTAATTALRQAQKDLEQSPLLASEGIKPEIVTALRKEITNLEEFERKKNDASTGVETADAATQNALVSLGGGDADTTKIESLDLEKANKLLDFARRAEVFQLDLAAFKKVKDWLQPGAEKGDVNSLRDGRRALNTWLVRIDLPGPALEAEQTRSTPLKSIPFLLSIVISLVFLAAAFISDVEWLLALALTVALGLALAGWLLRGARPKPVKTDNQHDPEHSKADYRKTGLESPTDWTPKAVEALLQKLDTQYDQARLEEERLQRWSDEKNRGVELKKKKEELELERARWREELGLDWDHDDLNTYLRAGQLRALYEARQALVSAKAAEKKAANNFDGLLEEIAETIERYGLPAPADCAMAHSTALELENFRTDYNQAQADLVSAQGNIKTADEQIKLREADRLQLLEAAGLTTGQEAELTARLEKLDDYQVMKTAHEAALTLLGSAQGALSDHPELLELTAEELAHRRNELELAAAKKSDLTEERIRLLERIEQAEARTDIAEKLAVRERAADVLRGRREEDQAAVTGDALATFVRQRYHEVDQTGIFSRARTLFTKFTRGYFKLEIDDDIENPGFRCIDTATGRGRSIEELSSNTRIQLLLSVRIAFVENQEQGDRKMPFILDEALAISDEQWAEEIIKAGIDICSDGRQFFYLTAQHDEVGKWRRLLDDTDLETRVIDLAEVRKFSQKERVPPQVFEPPPAVEVPSPAGMNHEAYGRTLEVPSIDQEAAVGGVHLWYLVEEPERLYELINNGINLWGQLENLVDSNNSENLTADSTIYKNAAASARVLESALRYRLVGRGRPVNRRVLKDSDCCGTHFEAVVEKTEELDGDGKRLVEALSDGEVKRFRKQKIAALEQYLEEHGFIPVEEELSPTEIDERVRRDVYNDIETGLLEAERLNWLIQQVLRDEQ